MGNAFFENGVFEIVLEEILEAQIIDSEIISYIQPYANKTMRYLKKIVPSDTNPIVFYLSTTTNPNMIEYTAEIVKWEDKTELFNNNFQRIEKLNEQIIKFQPIAKEIYKYSDDEKSKECRNLVSIRKLKKLSIPFTVGMLIKAENGEPYQERSQSGGWSEVIEYKYIEELISIEDITDELDKNITFSRTMDYSKRQERLENANQYPESRQSIVRSFKRNADVIVQVLDRANGFCERCECKAPFIRARDNTPYLEVHHKVLLSENGKDTVENAIALCPNCHRELHFGV